LPREHKNRLNNKGLAELAMPGASIPASGSSVGQLNVTYRLFEPEEQEAS
jgi:hypothetical protein